MKHKGSKDHGAGLRARAAAMMPDVASMMPAAPMQALPTQGPPQGAPQGFKKGGKVSDGLKDPVPITPLAKFAKGGKVKRTENPYTDSIKANKSKKGKC